MVWKQKIGKRDQMSGTELVKRVTRYWRKVSARVPMATQACCFVVDMEAFILLPTSRECGKTGARLGCYGLSCRYLGES